MEDCTSLHSALENSTYDAPFSDVGEWAGIGPALETRKKRQEHLTCFDQLCKV